MSSFWIGKNRWVVVFFGALVTCCPSVRTAFGDTQASDDDSTTGPAISNSATFEVDFRVVVTAPYKTRQLKIWLPIPQSDEFQTIESSKISTFPVEVEPSISKESKFGNQFAYFEVVNPNGALIIRHQFKAKLSDVRWDLDLGKVQPINEWDKKFAPYLQATSQLQNDPDFKDLLNGFSNSPQHKHNISAIIDWTNQNLTYDHTNSSLAADAEHAFYKRTGHCSDYHGLCAEMGRQLGFPTRVVYGLAMFEKQSPSHCKLESYLPPYGWVSFDVSESQKLIKKIGADSSFGEFQKKELMEAARNRLMAGFRENTWLKVTHGSNFHLAPKATQKVAVVRTIYAEADGVALPEPDPADDSKKEYSWMTAHKYSSDHPSMTYFAEVESLKSWTKSFGDSANAKR